MRKSISAAGDITTEAGRAAALAACPDPDILVNNAGGPPPGDFRDFTEEMWHAALNANMLSPIAMIKAVLDPMVARRFGRIVNITSAAVKSPIPIFGLSNGARAGLTGFVAGLARDVARHNVTINNLLPGPFDTDRLRATAAKSAAASGRSIDEEVVARGRQNRQVVSASRWNSAPPALSFVPPIPASSLAKICCSMAAPSTPRCDIRTKMKRAPVKVIIP